MAIIETKVMRVENSDTKITEISNDLACFGWTVTNVQVTHSQNSKTYSSAWDQLGGNQSQTVETTTINYATMSLQRDKTMQNYAQIKELENEYWALQREFDETEAAFENEINEGCLMMALKLCLWPITLIRFLLSLGKESKSDKLLKHKKEIRERQLEVCRKAEALLL
jgi:hypothetical protein